MERRLSPAPLFAPSVEAHRLAKQQLLGNLLLTGAELLCSNHSHAFLLYIFRDASLRRSYSWDNRWDLGHMRPGGSVS